MDKFETYQQNVREYEAGRLTELTCPRCQTATVSVRFAEPDPETDGPSTVYFVCSLCELYDTAQYRGTPEHFDRGLFWSPSGPVL